MSCHCHSWSPLQLLTKGCLLMGKHTCLVTQDSTWHRVGESGSGCPLPEVFACVLVSFSLSLFPPFILDSYLQEEGSSCEVPPVFMPQVFTEHPHMPGRHCAGSGGHRSQQHGLVEFLSQWGCQTGFRETRCYFNHCAQARPLEAVGRGCSHHWRKAF